MMRRNLVLPVLTSAVLAAGLLGSPPSTAAPAERVGPRSWTALAPDTSPNFAAPAVARTGDGIRHVVWLVEDGAGVNYAHTTITWNGQQGPVTKVFPTPWDQLSTPADLATAPDGTLRLAFRGTLTGSTADFFTYRGVYTAVSRDGVTWTVPREVLAVSDIGDGAATLAFTPDGTPVAGYGDTGGFHWHVGAISEAAEPTTTNQEFTDHDAMAASLVAYGGAVHVVYQSVRANGVFARQVWPALGAPVRAPGAYTNPGQPMAVVARPGVGPVVAYTVDDQVVLWDVVAGRTRRVPGMKGAGAVELEAMDDGRLWVAATGPIGYDPRASRVATRGWQVDREPVELPDLYATYGIGLASLTDVGAAVLLMGHDAGDPPRLHARTVQARLYVRARPRAWRVGRAQAVAFRVTDVDHGLRRVTVRAAGRRCTTNTSGRCTIRFAPVARPGRIRVTVSEAGYVTERLWLRVRR